MDISATLLSSAASRSEAPDEFVPDSQVVREFGITSMSLWRWDEDPALQRMGWPPAVYIRRRKFRSRRALEEFKAQMIRRAIEARNDKSAAPAASVEVA
jgi:hypothetical protein